MMTIFVTVMMIDNNGDWYFHWVGHGFLDVYGYVFLDMNGVRPVNGHLHWYGNVFLDWVWDVLLNGVWSGHWHFDGIRHGFLYMDGVWSVNVNFHGVWDRLLDWVRHRLLNRVRYRFGYVYGVRSVYVHFHWNMHFLDYGVRSGHMYRNLYGVWDLLLNWIGSWYVYLDGDMYFLFYGVRLGHVDLDGNRPVYWYMDWIRYLLLNRVGLRYMYRDFDDFLDWIRHMFDNWVRLRYMYLDRYGNMLFYRVRDVFLYWVGNWNIFDNSQSLMNLSVCLAVTTEITTETTSETTIKTTVESTVPVADVIESSLLVLLVFTSNFLVIGHCHFLFCCLGLFSTSEGQ